LHKAASPPRQDRLIVCESLISGGAL